MDVWVTLIATLTGAGIGSGAGFYTVWWQHRKRAEGTLRTKGSELITLGDQLYKQRHASPRHWRDGPSTEEIRQGLLDQMQAIVRYFEFEGNEKLYELAESLWVQTDWIGRGEGGYEEMEAAEVAWANLKGQLRDMLKNGKYKQLRRKKA